MAMHWTHYFLRAPVLVGFCCLMLGILLQSLFSFSDWLVGSWLGLALVMLLIALRTQKFLAAIACFCLVLTGAYSFSIQKTEQRVRPVCQGTPVPWRVQIQSPVKRNHADLNQGIQQVADVELLYEQCHGQWFAHQGLVRGFFAADPSIRRGDVVQAQMLVGVFEPSRNEMDPDIGFLVRKHGWVGKASVRSKHAIVMRHTGFLSFVDKARLAVANQLEHLLPASQAGIAKALVIGDNSGVSKTEREAWSRSGMAHLLAISGAHVGCLATLAFFFFRILLSFLPGAAEHFSIGRAAAVWTLPLVAAFCIWAGASPSAIRATIMTSAFLLGTLVLNRPGSATNSLGIAGCLLLLFDPMTLFDIGFMLSFSAVIAILWFSQANQQKHFGFGAKVRHLIIGTSLASVAATLGTAPFLAHFFGQVSLIAPLVNIVAVLWTGFVAMPIALMLSALAQMGSTMSSLAAHGLPFVLSPLEGLAQSTASFSFAAVSVPKLAWFELVAYFALLLFVLLWRKIFWAKHAAFASVILLVVSGLDRTFDRYFGDGSLTVIQPYVGQGGSTLVIFPKGSVLLFDAGGVERPSHFEPGRDIISKLLRHRNIRSIDVAVMSHAHPDHIGGMQYIAAHFPIKEVWWNGREAHNPVQQHVLEMVLQNNGTIRKASELPNQLDLEGVHIEVLHPRSSIGGENADVLQWDANDHSMVLRFGLGDRSILLPADIGKTAEAHLLPNLKPTDIFIAPHHGSNTSSSKPFLDALNPKLAIVSCGHNNRFSVPNQAVVERYQQSGIRMLRSDLDGQIEMRTQGEVWKVAAWRGTKLVIP